MNARVRAIVGRIADRLLRASDPWIGRRVRAWLGEQADQGRLSFEGGALCVRGARIPLGERLALTEIDARVMSALDLLRGMPVRVRVDRALLAGVEVPALTATAALTVTRDGWRVDDGVVQSADARAEVNAKGSFAAPDSFEPPKMRVDARIARIGVMHVAPLLELFRDALGPLRAPDDAIVSGDVAWDGAATFAIVVATALSRVSVAFRLDRGVGDVSISGHVAAHDAIAAGAIPEVARARVEALANLRASGEVTVATSRAIRAALDVTTNDSAIALTLALADGALAGTKIRGSFAFADAFALGLFPSAVRPRRVGVIEIDADVDGTFADPSIAGIASSPAVRLRLGDDATLPTLVFHDAALHLRVDRRTIAWRDLEARLLAGRLASSGEYSFADGKLDAMIGCAGLRLDAIPSDASGNTPLAEQLRGALFADLRLALADGAFSALGRARIVEPDYLFLTSAGERLARYGLPAPVTRGAGPVECEIGVRDRTVRAAPIVARLEGIDVDGEVEVGFDGALRGQLRAHLLQGYLRRSILLAVPAALADRVVIPITIAGTVREPDVSADLVHTLDDFLQRNPIGSAVAGVMDGVWSALGGPRSTRSSKPPPSADDPVEATIDRILAGDPETDRLIDDLADAGVDAEEIERRIKRRKR